MDTKIEGGILYVRFDAGDWNVVDHGAKRVLVEEDCGRQRVRVPLIGELLPVDVAGARIGKIVYVNEWGNERRVGVELIAPRRINIVS